ncbi:hypothetical protein [Fibrella forsythiae]|uniref:Lipoprotein n=1 Tax=Fibrella forsythiae TaxID=2817061 RepID=A0ABS3JLJ2_9BACT|nr:hypothetical protein [Fibrella forsythiae]MBO0950873.1 hypothetical protein [Fibrella forsythiae]
MHILRKLCGLFGLLFIGTSCQTIETRLPPEARRPSQPQYLSDEDDFQPLEGYDPFSRVAAADRGKMTFQYLSNEGEIITQQWQKITLWYYANTQPEPGAATRFSKPKYTIVHPANNRSYTRKSMSAGWYMLQLDDSETFQIVNVAAGSDGLYVFNQNNVNNSLFAGYYQNYGKLKFVFGSLKATKKKAAISLKTQAFLTLTKDGASSLFWLYADVATGTGTRSLFWFMPVGTYTTSCYGANLLGDSDTNTYPVKTGTVTIAPGKVYQTIML